MLEDFHARDHVPAAGLGGGQITGQSEPHSRQLTQTRRTFRDVSRIDVHAMRLAEVGVDHGDERSVATAVVKQTAAGPSGDNPPRQIEPAAVAPGDDAAAAEDLLPGIVAVSEKGWVHGNDVRIDARGSAGSKENLLARR